MGRGHNLPNEVLGNVFTLPTDAIPPRQLVYPTLETGPTLYVLPTIAIRSPNDMLSSPLRQHILDYKPSRRFMMPTFAMFDGSIDPYDQMLHYNQEMTLNARNDHLLCKVFPASLQGHALAWFHRLPHNSVNSFNELWTLFISQYLCSVWQKRNISSLQTIIRQEEESIRDFTRRLG